MEQLIKLWEKLDELAYVSDMETYDLIYANQKMLNLLGFSSFDQIQGKKCYEVLQHNSGPCSFCNNCHLTEGRYYKSHYYHPILEKYIYAYNTVMQHQGHLCRIELAVDITEHAESQNIAQKHQNLEQLLNEAVQIALQKPNPSDSINCLLEHLGKMIKGQRTYVFETKEDGSLYNSYEWTSTGVLSKKDRLQHIHADTWSPWRQALEQKQDIVISDVSTVRKTNPALYQMMVQQDIQSLVVVPIYSPQRKMLGFFGVDNPSVELIDTTASLLRIMGSIINSALTHRDMVQKLHDMSYQDQQTALGNRHALLHYMHQLLVGGDADLGVVFCDVTGLKHVNDTQGHAAGDALIFRASTVIREIFAGFGLFRYGGDEFLVICPNVTEQELTSRLEQLRRRTSKKAVILATGMSFGHICKGSSQASIERLISQAETQMYKDKSEYYKNSGMDRRKH